MVRVTGIYATASRLLFVRLAFAGAACSLIGCGFAYLAPPTALWRLPCCAFFTGAALALLVCSILVGRLMRRMDPQLWSFIK